MSKKDINEVIKGFDNLNMHFKTPKYTQKQIDDIEKDISCSLPADFKTTVFSGYIDKGTFHFLPLTRFEKNDRFLIFGKWNDDTFLFDLEAKTKESPVYVVVHQGEPEKCFDSFYDWLKAVLNAVNRANFPG